MIAEVLALTRWEWFKLRRRRLPWILLLVNVLLMQITFWASYGLYRANDEITLGVDPSTGIVGAVPPEVLALPNSAVFGLLTSHGFLAVLIMILTAPVTASGYRSGTTPPVRRVSDARWLFLASKLLLIVLLGAGATLVGTLSVTLSSQIAYASLEGGRGMAASAAWGEVIRTFAKVVYGLLPWICLAAFFAVLTKSTRIAIGLSIGYAVVESIVFESLAGFEWAERVSGFVMSWAIDDWLGSTEAQLASIGIGDDSSLGTAAAAAAQADALRGFLVSLAYILVLSGLAFWIFQRRDIAGAKGE